MRKASRYSLRRAGTFYVPTLASEFKIVYLFERINLKTAAQPADYLEEVLAPCGYTD